MALNESIKNFVDISNQATQKHYEWLRNILLTASGLIGILISLHNTKSNSALQHYFYSFSIGFIGLGILCCSIALYGEVHILNKLKNKLSGNLNEEIKTGVNPNSITGIKRDKKYDYCENICYYSFSFGIISLTIYAILIDQ
ncbi:MAG: hypothetical protein JNK50_00940 [Bacteroidia bacterium]|nr:hypothetical protein [Bacteroidia bacterium]